MISRRKLILAAPALLLSRRSMAAFHGSKAVASGGLKINLVYDNTQVAWTTSPAWYQTGVITAANAIMAAFPNTNITFNCEIGYQFFDGINSGNTIPVAASASEGADLTGVSNLPYSTIRSALAAVPNPTASLTALLNNTPVGTSINGVSSFYVPNAVCKSLGLGGVSPTGVALDGAVGIGTGWSSAKIVGVFIHEITHAMGRVAGEAPFNFSKFSSAGTRVLTNALVAAYFSLDGGTTPIANYDTTQDAGDFLDNSIQDSGLGGFQDCFDTHQNTNALQSLSTVDLQLMNAMGFQ